MVINGRTQESVDKAAAALKAATGKMPLTFAGDMSKPDDIAKLVKAWPNVDILVNNVARFAARPFTELTDQDWYDSFDLNVMSGVRLSRDYLPGMKQRNWGRIIFISSESGLQIPVESVAYGMTKAAEIAVARGIAESASKTGVTVNSILPDRGGRFSGRLHCQPVVLGDDRGGAAGRRRCGEERLLKTGAARRHSPCSASRLARLRAGGSCEARARGHHRRRRGRRPLSGARFANTQGQG